MTRRARRTRKRAEKPRATATPPAEDIGRVQQPAPEPVQPKPKRGRKGKTPEVSTSEQRETKPTPEAPHRTAAVIIPAHKAGWCLHEGVAAIANQTEKPDTVMIGADACVESAEAAQAARVEFAGRLDIRVFFFPRHVGPYRIRNTLAALAPAEVLHFFDADDLMYPEHCALMGKHLERRRFMGCEAEMIRDPGQKPEPWHRAIGVCSILKVDFIQNAGFEPWLCGADTEAQQRWQAGGIKKFLPTVPTCLIRKHSGSLTMMADTGYKSAMRAKYRAVINARHDAPLRLGTLAIADVVELTAGQALDSTVAAYQHAMPLPAVPLQETEKPPAPPPVDPGEALAWVRALINECKPGFDRHKREFMARARQWLTDQETNVQRQTRTDKGVRKA